MKEEIYYKHCENPNSPLLKTKDEDLLVKIVKPSWFKSKRSFLWSIETLFGGTFREYQLWRGNKLVSTADVVSWIPQFPFMPKNSLHIGPCVTMKDERGRGYYPYLLLRIVLDNPTKKCYMIVSPKNLPSTRGVIKAGFRPFAKGHRSRFGRYVINNNC